MSYTVPAEHSHLISVSDSGIVTSVGPEGAAVLEMRQEGRVVVTSVQVSIRANIPSISQQSDNSSSYSY